MLEDNSLDGKARLCYGVMGSFGAEARASLKAIARRMGVKHDETVKAAQRQLVAKGWLFLVAEGSGRHPRAWYMADRPFEWLSNKEAEAEVVAAIALEKQRRDSEAAKKQGGGKTGPLKKGAPTEPPPKQEELPNNSEDLFKQETPPPAPAGPGWSHQDLVNDYFEAWKALQAEMTPVRSLDLQAHIKRGVKALGALSKASGFDRGEYLRRLANMGKHKFHAKKDHALNYFCSTYSEFADGQRSLEEAPGRRYHASGTDDFA